MQNLKRNGIKVYLFIKLISIKIQNFYIKIILKDNLEDLYQIVKLKLLKLIKNNSLNKALMFIKDKFKVMEQLIVKVEILYLKKK